MKLHEVTIAQYDAWAQEDVEKLAVDLVNKAVERVGDDLDPENVIRKIKTGWSGLNPRVVSRAIEIVKNEAPS